MDGERSGVRDDGGPEASAGRDLDLRREDVLLLLRGMQGVVRSDSREVREVTSSSGGDSPAKVYANTGSSRAVESGEAPSLWSRFTWSRALFAVLLLNLVWTASLFVCPATLPPGSTPPNLVGGANLVDHEGLWETFPLYDRIIYTIGDAQCHQLYYRSFWLNGNQMPIDERMTAMYVFANLGLLATIFARPSTSTGQVLLNALPEFLRRRLARLGVDRAGALVIAFGLIPMAVDGFTQLFKVGGYESTPLARVLTGGLAGFVGGLLIGAMLVTIRAFAIEIQQRYADLQANALAPR